MTRSTLALASLFLLIAFPAWATDLQGARSAGAVGEKQDGYIAPIQQSPDIAALVASVNSQRQQEYARISQQKGQPVDIVAKLAAGEIVKTLPAGSLYQGTDGSWVKK